MGRTDYYPQADVGTRPGVEDRPSQYFEFSAVRIKKRSVALFLMRLPAFIPWILIIRGWLNLNSQEVLTNTEADVLGTGGALCFFIALTITPAITMTGAQWIAPLRRWYGIMFALIGISDGTTAAITTDFAGGPLGRLAGHTFLLSGFLIVLIALPILATANTPMQRRLGRWWKRLQKVTYVLWGLVLLHLLLLDGITPFQNNGTDGDPVFHQRFYQVMALSAPLFVLRLPPVRRWVIEQRTAGRAWLPWLVMSPLLTFYLIGIVFMINEEFFTGLKVITMTNLFHN
jgi:DMSO/TMAO reductase YedYZ heme-binding membrane subunit